MVISAQIVKELRDRTGVGVMDCRRALTEAQGNVARAESILKGRTTVKDPTRATHQGVIEAYIHPGGNGLGALIELNCETDFVARTDDFKTLAREIAMHVAGANPTYIDRTAIPAHDLAALRAEIVEQLQLTGHDPSTIDARLEAHFKEIVLLEQPYVRDPKQTIHQLILEVTLKTRENIRVGRFARFQITS